MSGVLALVGGSEFEPGNERQDRILVEAAAGSTIAGLPQPLSTLGRP